MNLLKRKTVWYAICNAAWTPEVIAAYQVAEAARVAT
jgi:hypothetical protein